MCPPPVRYAKLLSILVSVRIYVGLWGLNIPLKRGPATQIFQTLNEVLEKAKQCAMSIGILYIFEE